MRRPRRSSSPTRDDTRSPPSRRCWTDAWRATMPAMLTLPGPVVDVGWLRDHLEHPSLRLADVRWSLAGPSGRAAYGEGHIPHAVFLDAEDELASPGEGP